MKSVVSAFRRLKERLIPSRKKKPAVRRSATARKAPKRKASPARKKTSGRGVATKARPAAKALLLEKHEKNPILRPNEARTWETKAVFNPAAIRVGGKVHLAYRAIGDDDRSALGYAASRDGLHFDERLEEPMYVAREGFEGSAHRHATAVQGPYVSGGGGWGGVEDPRMTRIGDRIYMTYVAYDGWSPPRVALTSIAVDDFLAKNWNWLKPVLISPPGIVNKNACLFPEKVRGKYVMLHRVFPHILLDYLDDLEFDGKTKWLKGQHKISPSKDGWDSRKVGAGAPPIRTDRGWLLIYQAVGESDPGRYKMGAMLLDLEHPEKVLARSKEPILAPDEWYENAGWKSGVAYPCGAVVKDGQLIVYYGGADTFVCAATSPIEPFLDHLEKDKTPKLTMAAKAGPKRKRNA